MKLKYRIVEFPVANEDGQRFFVETGHVYSEKYWAFIYLRKIRWELHSAHKDWDTAIKALGTLKETEPRYHVIK